MKKKYSLLTTLILIIGSVQWGNTQCDTLRNWSPGIVNQYQIFSDNAGGGYIPGHLNFGDGDVLRWAEQYSVAAATNVRAIRIGVHNMKNPSGASILTLKVWANNAGIPGNELGTQDINFNNINPGALPLEFVFNVLEFDNPVSVNGTFFVGYELNYANADDTIAFVSQNNLQTPASLRMFTTSNGWQIIDDIYLGAKLNGVTDVLVSNALTPTPDFISNSSLELCLGSSWELDGTSSIEMQEWNWELWSLDAQGNLDELVDTDNNGPIATLTPNAIGEYAIFLISDQSCITQIIGYSGFEVLPEFTYELTINDEECGNADGSIVITNMNGGPGDFYYSWTSPFYLSAGNAADTSGLEAGTYNIQFGSGLVDGTNLFIFTGCEVEQTVVINNIPGEAINIGTGSTICNGDNAILTASGNGAISWETTGGIPVGSGPSIQVNPSTTTTYVALLTDANDCTDEALVTITVNQIDNATFTFNNFCEGSPNQATNIVLPGGNFDFNPAPGDGATINASTGGITNGVLGTTYSVEYTTNGACPSSSIQTVTVQSSDDASFVFNTICIGTPALPSGIATTGGSFDFLVTPTDGATINTSTGEILNPVAGNSYQVEYTTPSGVCQSSEVLTVSAFVLPTVSASADQTICDGDTIIISANGANTYSWDNGLGGGDTHSVSPSANTTYIVVGTDGNGCAASDVVTIDVNPTPTVGAGDDETICEGTSITLTATNPNGAIISWANGVTDGVSFAPANSATYQVTAVLGTCEATDDVTITVTNAPVVSAGNDIVACEGDEIILTANNPDGAVISWNNGVNDGVAFTPTNGTLTYIVTANLSGCVAADEVDVTVNTLPTVSMGSDEEMCNTAGIFSLTGTPTGGIFSGPGVTGNEFDPNTAGVGNHSITYIFEDANGCSNAASAIYTVDDCSSLVENNLSNNLILSPNPSSTHIDITVSGNDLMVSSIQLISLEGRVLSVQNNSALENTIRVDVSSYAKGTYLALIETSRGDVVKKFIVQ